MKLKRILELLQDYQIVNIYVRRPCIIPLKVVNHKRADNISDEPLLSSEVEEVKVEKDARFGDALGIYVKGDGDVKFAELFDIIEKMQKFDIWVCKGNEEKRIDTGIDRYDVFGRYDLIDYISYTVSGIQEYEENGELRLVILLEGK